MNDSTNRLRAGDARNDAAPAAARGSLLTQHLTAACWWISLVLLGGLAGFLWAQGSGVARVAAGAALVVAAIVLVRQILTTPHNAARPSRVNS